MTWLMSMSPRMILGYTLMGAAIIIDLYVLAWLWRRRRNG